MALLNRPGIESPIQLHEVSIATELFWATGTLESLGNPNLYVNQDDLTYMKLNESHLRPWSFTGLPTSSPEEVLIRREKIQMLFLESEEAISQYRVPPRTGQLAIYLPLAVIKGQVPYYSEAKFVNFLDFWKGDLLPVSEASVHFLASGVTQLPLQAELVYVHRNHILAYVEA